MENALNYIIENYTKSEVSDLLDEEILNYVDDWHDNPDFTINNQDVIYEDLIINKMIKSYEDVYCDIDMLDRVILSNSLKEYFNLF